MLVRVRTQQEEAVYMLQMLHVVDIKATLPGSKSFLQDIISFQSRGSVKLGQVQGKAPERMLRVLATMLLTASMSASTSSLRKAG